MPDPAPDSPRSSQSPPPSGVQGDLELELLGLTNALYNLGTTVINDLTKEWVPPSSSVLACACPIPSTSQLFFITTSKQQPGRPTPQQHRRPRPTLSNPHPDAGPHRDRQRPEPDAPNQRQTRTSGDRESVHERQNRCSRRTSHFLPPCRYEHSNHLCISLTGNNWTKHCP